MNAPEKGPTERKTGSAEAKRRAIAVIGAGACSGAAAGMPHGPTSRHTVELLQRRSTSARNAP